MKAGVWAFLGVAMALLGFYTGCGKLSPALVVPDVWFRIPIE